MILQLLVFLFLLTVSFSFEVPNAQVEVLKPLGLRVSIPDMEGIKLFAFHGKVNEELNGRESGTFSRDVTKAKNGKWTFYDPTANLSIGDTLYYWTYVDYFDGKNKLGYTNDDQEYKVEIVLDKRTNVPITAEDKKPFEPSGSCLTTVNGKPACNGKEIFSETFQTFDQNIWKSEKKFAGPPDFEFVFYDDRNEVIKIENGMLKIKPTLTDDLYGPGFVSKNELDLGNKCTGMASSAECVIKPESYIIIPPVVSAQISTKKRFAFRLGVIEIRAKLPQGDWLYPELFLSPVEEYYGPNYQSGQIRVAFLEGNGESARLYGGCVLGNSTEARRFSMRDLYKTQGNWTHDFHVFKVYWSKDMISFSVDDKLYGNIEPPENGFKSIVNDLRLGYDVSWSKGTKFAPFDKEMYITLGVGVGGQNFEDRSDGSKPWAKLSGKGQKNFYRARSNWKSTWSEDSSLIVDYIKVWAL